jgi:NADPH:quinone reductase-like Zn-dependent oxidoreductase
MKCIFIDAKSELQTRDITDQYQPQGGQALIRTEFSGVNPADIAHARFLGMNDNVCGYEFCGVVIEVGTTSRYARGDVVFGSNEARKGRPQYHGAHQDLVIAESDSLSMILPANVPHADAAALSIMIRTAADALLNLFEIPFPVIGFSAPSEEGGLLIWGGASTVGCAAIQLAKAMNIKPILTTASPSNHQALIKLGATQCFDYRDPEVVGSVQAAIESSGRPLRYIFDTVCKEGDPGTIEMCESLHSPSSIKYVCCLPQPRNPRWRMVLATRARDFPFPPPLPPSKANAEWDSRLEKTVKWAVENYGNGFQIPQVTVVHGGGEGIKAIKDVFAGKASFQKMVIQHPI